MPLYRCPECKTTLKKKEPVEPGKKLKCPKCATIFAAKPIAEEPEPASTPKAATPPKVEKKSENLPQNLTEAQIKIRKAMAEEEEESAGVYLTKHEVEKVLEDVNYGSLRDKYFKSKKGPAMAMTIKASNYLIFWGVILGILGLATIVFAAWPYIFDSGTGKRMSRSENVYQIIVGSSGFLCMIVATIICWGASKLQNLESYVLAWIGAILGLPVGVYAIYILTRPEVKEGFEEVAEGEVQ